MNWTVFHIDYYQYHTLLPLKSKKEKNQKKKKHLPTTIFNNWPQGGEWREWGHYGRSEIYIINRLMNYFEAEQNVSKRVTHPLRQQKLK